MGYVLAFAVGLFIGGLLREGLNQYERQAILERGIGLGWRGRVDEDRMKHLARNQDETRCQNKRTKP